MVIGLSLVALLIWTLYRSGVLWPEEEAESGSVSRKEQLDRNAFFNFTYDRVPLKEEVII